MIVSLPESLQLPHTHKHTCNTEFNETNLHWYDIPWVIAVFCASSSVSCLRLQHKHSNTAELHGLMWEKTAYFAPSHCPDHINNSALWTSASACIMDDIAEGLARQRGWVPKRDNEPPFSCGKCVEGLVTSISNLSKSDTNLQQMQDPTGGLM